MLVAPGAMTLHIEDDIARFPGRAHGLGKMQWIFGGPARNRATTLASAGIPGIACASAGRAAP